MFQYVSSYLLRQSVIKSFRNDRDLYVHCSVFCELKQKLKNQIYHDAMLLIKIRSNACFTTKTKYVRLCLNHF